MQHSALELRDLQAWYGESHVLHGVDILVKPGEVVTLLGPPVATQTPPLAATSNSSTLNGV